MQEGADSGTQLSWVSVLMLFLFCNRATGSQKQEYACPVCMCPGARVYVHACMFVWSESARSEASLHHRTDELVADAVKIVASGTRARSPELLSRV